MIKHNSLVLEGITTIGELKHAINKYSNDTPIKVSGLHGSTTYELKIKEERLVINKCRTCGAKGKEIDIVVLETDLPG